MAGEKLGFVVQDTWHFFEDIARYLKYSYETSVFSERTYQLPFLGTKINRWILHHDLDRFMSGNGVVFFEWASRYLAEATHRPKQCKIVTRLHRYELYTWADRVDWNNVDRVILVSETMKQAFLSRFPACSSKAVVVPNGVPLDKFTSQERRFQGTIGTLCRVVPLKRVYELILAFSELLESGLDVRLLVGGPMPEDSTGYVEALHFVGDRLGLGDRVDFQGYVEDVSEWYRAIDIFVSNSYREAMQVSLLEAMASGCYCLAHHWHGVSEILPEENLFFTERGFVAKVQSYCALPAKQQRVCQRQMRQLAVEKFDIERTKRQIKEIVASVANGTV